MSKETIHAPVRSKAARAESSGSAWGRAAFLALVFAASLAATAPARATTTSGGRLIVLGFDGADARTVEDLMRRGEMPNCARLRDTGTFAALGTTMPAESPVSWASLNSGQNPAKTGIAGFVKRSFDADGYPTPAPGHVGHEARSTETMRLPGVARLLSTRAPAANAAILGGVSFLGFLFVFAFLLKIRRGIAFLLSALLGGAGAYGAWVCSGYVPREISDVVANPTRTGGFWEVAARAGVPCVVLDAAMEWDRPDEPNLKLLAGLGVPDARSSNGDWFVYTTSDDVFARVPEGEETDTGGRVFRVDEYGDKIESVLYGPQNFWLLDRERTRARELRSELARPGQSDARVDRLRAQLAEIEEHVLPRLEGTHEFQRSQEGRCSLPIQIERRRAERRATVTIGGQSQDVAEGAWSNWYRLTFELNPLVKVKAITRCKLESLADPFRLYVDVLQIDPADPVFWQPISRPHGFASQLAQSIDAPYETVGWACMTMPFKDREIDPITFLEDIQATHETRAKLLRAALARDDWRVLVDVESTPDRVQHMMYQYLDTEHPLYDAAAAARTTTYFGQVIPLSDAIPATYRALDRLVGEVLEHLKPGDTLLVCADHGFQSFRRQVHLNNWLQREGFLVTRDGLALGDRRYLNFVDWSKTRAYAVGLGMIFLNRVGREPHGIVSEAEAPALLEQIAARLKALEDPANGARVVESVYEMARLHSGPHLGDEADLMPGFAAHYRVSWGTTTGGIALDGGEGGAPVVIGPVVEDNASTWSGDHVSVAAHLVRGIFFSNRRVEVPPEGIDLLHIAPTALSVLGVPVPPEYDRPPLVFRP